MAQQARWMTALDTFVITLPDGADHCVTKGSMRMSNHALVTAAPGLWQEADTGEPDEPPEAPKSAAKAEAKAEADVKPAAPSKPAPAGRGKAS